MAFLDDAAEAEANTKGRSSPVKVRRRRGEDSFGLGQMDQIRYTQRIDCCQPSRPRSLRKDHMISEQPKTHRAESAGSIHP
jgi:hypothetical protein